ncbi:hypothetical protein PG994_004928 [Apiospora phragmitis]|uniref:Uncharacterized protein n=1 Tax=Apiospora phragmitis TaxID=2905665 RepID=A0ABR1VVU5_9PEZI
MSPSERERLGESLRLEHHFARMILYLGLANANPEFALRCLEALRGVCDTITQLPEDEGGASLSRKDLADLEEMAKVDIESVLRISEPVQKRVMSKLRKQVEVAEERASYGSARSVQEELCRHSHHLYGRDHPATLEAQLKLAVLKQAANSPASKEEAMRILRRLMDNLTEYWDTGFGQRVMNAYEQHVGFHGFCRLRHPDAFERTTY